MRCFLGIFLIQIGLIAEITWSLNTFLLYSNTTSDACHTISSSDKIRLSQRASTASSVCSHLERQRLKSRSLTESAVRRSSKLQKRGRILSKPRQDPEQKQKASTQLPGQKDGISSDRTQSGPTTRSQASANRQNPPRRIISALRPFQQALVTPLKWLANAKNKVSNKGLSLIQKGKLLSGGSPVQNFAIQWKQNPISNLQRTAGLGKLSGSNRKALTYDPDGLALLSSSPKTGFPKSHSLTDAASSSEIATSLRKTKSAPKLSDLPSIEAYAAEQKAAIIRKAGVEVQQTARNSRSFAGGLMSTGFMTETELGAGIKRYKTSHRDAHTYADHQAQLARAYSDAAQKSLVANRPIRRARNEMKRDAAVVESNAWRSVAKASSYLSQIGQGRLADQKDIKRDRAALRNREGAQDLMQQGMFDAVEMAMVQRHQQDSLARLNVLTDKWENAKVIAGQHFDRLTRLQKSGGYDSESDEPPMASPPLRQDWEYLARPYTPSPTSSSGRLYDEDRPRRRLSSSSSSSSGSE